MKKNRNRSFFSLFFFLCLALLLSSCHFHPDSLQISDSTMAGTETEPLPASAFENARYKDALKPDPDKAYVDLEDVVNYLLTYGVLPKNYITKAEANKMGWSIHDTKGYVIGGDRFGNREGRLPSAPGRKYFEADLAEGYGRDRGPLRLVYSNDGLIYYTGDHYETFALLTKEGANEDNSD
ncbi:MAG: ribonuclease domain-containing protein [Peptoniphilaceae bacterium]|nr:ribonuclease domain-containing protein [Peptoniphilaceae bacterium]MDY5766350.1 ribonuclease domain-containing protein [Peptoniphilaceae bacterium]